MFKLKQKVYFDEDYNVIRYEEYHDNELTYWENNKYSPISGKLLSKETINGTEWFDLYPHKIKMDYENNKLNISYVPVSAIQNIQINIGFRD